MRASWLPYWIYPIYMFVYVYINISGPVVTYAHIFALYKGRSGLLSRPGKVWYKTCLGLGMGGGLPLGGNLGQVISPLCLSLATYKSWLVDHCSRTPPSRAAEYEHTGCAQHCCRQGVPRTEAAV